VEQAFQLAEADGTLDDVPIPPNTIIAYLIVGQPDQTDCETEVKQIPSFDVLSLNDVLARIPVPSYLAPVRDEEIEIARDEEKKARKLSGSQRSYRTRRVDYSGWGSANWPFFQTKDLIKFDRNGPSPDKINPVYLAKAEYGGKTKEIVLPPSLRTMAIDGRKFDPNDETTPRMLVDTAEEWVVYNNSITLFGPFPPKRQGVSDAVYDYERRHTVGYPVTRAEASRRGWKITTRGIDHPFHIHTNPFWVTRLEVPDENGNLVNIIDEPRWQDVVWIPRNAGRVVFRSRFTDYVGEMVNHCHILLHEDNGMMQSSTITADPRQANYTVGKKLADSKMTPEECSRANPHYQPVSLEQAYVECTHFLDPNQNPHRYQEYPAKNGAFRPPRPPR
jgi:hypothetical protein